MALLGTVVVAVVGRLGRLLAVLGFILSREFGLVFGVADKALGVGAVVLVAPIAFGLELCDLFGVALRADFFRHAVLVAPPAVVAVATVRMARSAFSRWGR